MNLPNLIHFYENLSPEDVDRFPSFYTEDARFKDPFNDVAGVAGIQRIFRHMFEQVAEPRFTVLETIHGETGTVLVWDFHFRPRLMRCPGPAHRLHGVSHLRFAPDGRVCYHRDYWDTAEELYFRVPGLGLVLRGLRRALAA